MPFPLRLRILGLTATILWLVLSTGATPAAAHTTPAYSYDNTVLEQHVGWLSELYELKPDLRVSELSIPGTHDSGSNNPNPFEEGGISAQTQGMSIGKQLEAGIRAFDLRLGLNEDCRGNVVDGYAQFYIFHANYCQYETFDDVLATMVSFLDAHPGEAIFVRVKQEGKDGWLSPPDFAKSVNQRYLAPLVDRHRVYTGAGNCVDKLTGPFNPPRGCNTDADCRPPSPGCLSCDPTNVCEAADASRLANPTLEDVRGKIVVLEGYKKPGAPAWPGSLSWGNLKIQDAYAASSRRSLAGKWNGSGYGYDCANDSYPNGCESTNVVGQLKITNIANAECIADGVGYAIMTSGLGFATPAACSTDVECAEWGAGFACVETHPDGATAKKHCVGPVGCCTGFQTGACSVNGGVNDIYVNFLSMAGGLGNLAFVDGMPYFFASGKSLPATGASRYATGWTRGTLGTCGDAANCLPEFYYPSLSCTESKALDTRTCSVYYEGLNELTMHHLTSSDHAQWLWRTGIVYADFPGPGLISGIIDINKRQFNHDRYDVGVIPEKGTCGNRERAVKIVMDDENDDNQNASSGWLGASSQDKSRTELNFCRVDGRRFGNPAGAGRHGDYAVLKLGAECPQGSQLVARLSHNEKDDNESFIVGDAWPNQQNNSSVGITATQLYFCLFHDSQPAANLNPVDTFPDFPDMPEGYGVFARPYPRTADGFAYTARGSDGSRQWGHIRSDDEDLDNKNAFSSAAPAGLTEAIFGGGSGTDFFLAKVQGHCGDGRVEAELGEQCDDGNSLAGDCCSADCTQITGQVGDACNVRTTATGEPLYAPCLQSYCDAQGICVPRVAAPDDFLHKPYRPSRPWHPDNPPVDDPGTPESGAQCANNVDDDGDTVVNDGCPAVGVGEPDQLLSDIRNCGSNLDDDGDGVVNDGCPSDYGPDGAECEDFNACTGTSTCQMVCDGNPFSTFLDCHSECRPHPQTVTTACPLPENACETNEHPQCVPAEGCPIVVKPDQTPCGDPCFTNDQGVCASGKCVGEPKCVTHGDPYCMFRECQVKTNGFGQKEGDCLPEETQTGGVPCFVEGKRCGRCEEGSNDGNECDSDSACPGGRCIERTIRLTGVCSDRTGSCVVASAEGCTDVYSVIQCDDGNACTTDAVFLEGRDTNGNGAPDNFCSHEPADCEDGNPCTSDTCDPAAGCQHTPPVACDDGDVCTVDSCDKDLQCAHSAARSCDDANACTADSCVGVSECEHAAAVVCPPPTSTCHEPGTCDPQTGLCSNPTKADDTTCADDDPCALPETGRCRDGECQSTLIDCDDDNPCTADHCDGSGNAPLCEHDNNGVCIGPNCGNEEVDGADGETCDPPNFDIDPTTGKEFCRKDCTSCGDGVVQRNDQETCDDGNEVSGCDPVRPQKALDKCQNECAPPICSDPSSITLGPGLDRFYFHGRLTSLTGANDAGNLDPSDKMLVVQLTTPEGHVVFRSSLLAGTIQKGRHRFHYKNNRARKTGGIQRLRLTPVQGAYRATLIAYSDLNASQADMKTEVFVGDQKWTIEGDWERMKSGWRLTPKGTVAH